MFHQHNTPPQRNYQHGFLFVQNILVVAIVFIILFKDLKKAKSFCLMFS